MPPKKRSKVGLTRMDAAVDSMRPMEFPPVLVRKCVRKLLKVYGDDGWPFIEEAAYKLLIETILEEIELEQTSDLPLLEGGEQGSCSHQEPVQELCDKEVICEEQEQKNVHEADENINTEQENNGKLSLDVVVTHTPLEELCEKEAICEEQEHKHIHEADENINVSQEKDGKLNLDVMVTPTPLEDVDDQSKAMVKMGFALAYTPHPIDSTPTNRKHKPCFGWISDDE